jgi:hypothetical protein
MAAFGKVLPVIGLNLGFPGAWSRTGEKVVTARQLLATTPTPLYFGDTAVIVPDALGGTNQSVRDFIAGGGTMTPALFAGIAYREIKTQLTFPYTPGAAEIGSYLPGEMSEILERGSVVVPLLVGTPASQGNVYLRIALNGGIPAGVVGGIEAAADGANTINLGTVGVVFRTGVVDANGNVEITLRSRNAA